MVSGLQAFLCWGRVSRQETRHWTDPSRPRPFPGHPKGSDGLVYNKRLLINKSLMEISYVDQGPKHFPGTSGRGQAALLMFTMRTFFPVRSIVIVSFRTSVGDRHTWSGTLGCCYCPGPPPQLVTIRALPKRRCQVLPHGGNLRPDSSSSSSLPHRLLNAPSSTEGLPGAWPTGAQPWRRLWNIREGPYPSHGVGISCCGWGQLPKPGSEPGLDVSLGKSTPICVYKQ